MMRRTFVLVLALSGCWHTVGPIVTDATLDHSGKLHTTRCNLVEGNFWWNSGSDYEDCRDETGTPTKSFDRSHVVAPLPPLPSN
jgi:hypothetical protein